MTRLKTAGLAILGTAAIIASVLAGPAMAKDTMAKDATTKSTMAKATKTKTLAKDQRHIQRHATNRSERFRNANAALTSGKSDRLNRRAAGPGNVVGNVVGGTVATAGAIATAPFRAWDNNYYGYGYGGRDWRTYAAHNGLACAPGTTYRGGDGRRHLCQ